MTADPYTEAIAAQIDAGLPAIADLAAAVRSRRAEDLDGPTLARLARYTRMQERLAATAERLAEDLRHTTS